jgi:hypothetical protein
MCRKVCLLSCQSRTAKYSQEESGGREGAIAIPRNAPRPIQLDPAESRSVGPARPRLTSSQTPVCSPFGSLRSLSFLTARAFDTICTLAPGPSNHVCTSVHVGIDRRNHAVDSAAGRLFGDGLRRRREAEQRPSPFLCKAGERPEIKSKPIGPIPASDRTSAVFRTIQESTQASPISRKAAKSLVASKVPTDTSPTNLFGDDYSFSGSESSESQGRAQRPEKPRQPSSKFYGSFEEDEEERLQSILQEIEERRHRRMRSADTRRTASTPQSVAHHCTLSEVETFRGDTDAWADRKPFERCASVGGAYSKPRV